ncbi:MAG: FHA domain-containing protein [Gemmatimonadales bacterium]
MSYLDIGGQRHAIPPGEIVVGSDSSAAIVLSGEGVAPRHLVVQGLPDGQVVIRLVEEGLAVRVNGVALGPQPTPLLHGDKVELGPHALMFVDERKSGSTQYVQAVDPALLSAAAKPSAKRGPTGTTGGRLVSLTDGREYAVAGASLVIGRDAGCDVVLTSKNVSRRHAEIMVTPKGYVIVDSSTNGTIVNGERVAGQQLLARGDVIQCGEYEFRFYADRAPEPIASPEPPAPAQPVAPPVAEELAGPPAPPAPPASPVPTAAEPPSPAAAPTEPAAAPPEPAAAPGAEHRLSDTLHGVPGVERPEMPRMPRTPPAAPKRPPAPPVSPRTGEDLAIEAEVPQPPKPPPAAREAKGPPVLANLVVRSGGLRGQKFPIRVPVVNVGRADYNDIVLPDDSVSTQHAKLQRREGIWVLVDLESTNGTMVDGEVVSGEVPLAPGAYIRFGEVQTIFEPTDDTIDAKKGSSTRVLGAIQLPQQELKDKPS